MRAGESEEPALLRWLRHAESTGAGVPHQAEIGRRFGVSQPTASRMLSRMAARGEIVIARSGQRNRITVTEGARHG